MGLSNLPNIGKRLEQELEQIGINNLEDLIDLGSVEVVLRLQLEDLNVCYNKLYAIEGAIQGVRWHSIPNEDRTRLKAELKRAHPSQKNIVL